MMSNLVRVAALIVTTVMMTNASQAGPVTWKLAQSADHKRLIVDVTIANTTKAKLYVAKQLVTSAPGNKFTRSDRLTVLKSDDPAVARFVLGAVSPEHTAHRLYQPTVEALAPGATTTRHYELPLPLTAWHPLGANPVLPATIRSAKLYVYAIEGEPAGWDKLASADTQPLEIPQLATAPLILEGATLALP